MKQDDKFPHEEQVETNNNTEKKTFDSINTDQNIDIQKKHCEKQINRKINILDHFKENSHYFNFLGVKQVKIFEKMLVLAKQRQILNKCYLTVSRGGKLYMFIDNTRFKSLDSFF